MKDMVSKLSIVVDMRDIGTRLILDGRERMRSTKGERGN